MKLFRFALVLALISSVGCSLPTSPTPTQPIVINNTNTNLQGGGGTGLTPTPTPGGGVIVFVRTGFFGGSCANGGEVRNGAPMKVGCVGFATATPLGPNDVKLTPTEHGYECAWSNDHPEVVQLLDVGDNPFNIDVKALAAGTAHITATVKGVVGSFDVTVVQ
jgi:hypothetical protein